MKEKEYENTSNFPDTECLSLNSQKKQNSCCIFSKDIKKATIKAHKRPFSPPSLKNDWMMFNIDTNAPYGRISSFVKDILSLQTLRKSKSINTSELKPLKQDIDKGIII